MPIDAAAAPRERLHPLTFVTGLAKAIRGAWGLLVAGGYLVARGDWFLAGAVVGGFSLIGIVGQLLAWLKFDFRVGRDEVRIDRGFLNRSSRTIPFDRITDIDIEQGPIHRLLGLARVRFETGASAGADGEDGVLDSISLARAQAIREHVRARRRGDTSAADAVVETEAAPLFAMDARRVGLAGLFNFSLIIIAGLFGASQTLGDVIGFDPFARSFWRSALAEIGPLRDFVLAHRVTTAIAGAVVLAMLGITTGMVRTVLREHGFRLDRSEHGLRRRRGLATLTDVTIPAKRVQAATLASGPVRRRFGWWVLKLQSLASDGKHGDHVVAPLATASEAQAIAATLGLALDPRNAAWRRLVRGYVPAGFPLPAIVLAVGAIQAAVGLWTGWPLVLAAPALVAWRWLDWRQSGWALDGGQLFIARGWWRDRRFTLPVRKIQSIEIVENAWTRRFGYCALTVGVAGGNSTTSQTIPALTRIDAERLRADLLGA